MTRSASFDRVVVPVVGAVSLLAALLEAWRPLRARGHRRGPRWKANGGVALASGTLARFAVLPSMLAVAARIGDRGHGPLGRLPRAVRFIAALVLLDHAMYLWHRANHGVPFLWRFHAPHHTDPDLDVSTAFRFHPLEVASSLPVRCLQVALLGATSREVLVYEALLQSAAAFHHSNTRLPAWLERLLSLAMVTPIMHGLHHSDVARELQSSWGVVLSVWDRLYGTRSYDPARDVTVGVPGLPPATTARSVLFQPLGVSR